MLHDLDDGIVSGEVKASIGWSIVKDDIIFDENDSKDDDDDRNVVVLGLLLT